MGYWAWHRKRSLSARRSGRIDRACSGDSGLGNMTEADLRSKLSELRALPGEIEWGDPC